MKLLSWQGLALLLWPLVAFLTGWQVAPLGGAGWAGALGAALGVLLHQRYGEVKLRLPAAWAAAALSASLCWLASHLLLEWDWPSQLLGSDRAFLIIQDLVCFWGWATLLLAMRWSSARWHPFIAIEGGVAALSIVWIFSGHRQGFINRPFFLVDPLWGQGYDPLPVFLGLGIAAALLVGSLAASHHKGRRPLWDLPLLVLLLALAFMLLPPGKVKEWSEKYGMADGKGKEERLADQDKIKNTRGDGGKSKPDKSKDKDKGKDKEPSFADQQKSKQNPPVAVVVFRDDYAPESGYYYFRQEAFSEYNGIKLVRSSNAAFDRDNPDGFPTHYQAEKPEGETLGIQPPALDQTAFRSIPTRVAVMNQNSRAFGLSNPIRFWACENPDPKRFIRAFEVESLALTLTYRAMFGRKAGDPGWSPESWAHYLRGPQDPRYKELVDKILTTLPPEHRRDDFYKAVAIKLWLDDNTTYSLHSPHQDSADPVGDYLFGDRVGYCVFTSHSACYLFRAAGIPSRIAGGYAVPAASKGSGSTLLIRSKEAHSWPEIYMEGLGWIELDISPKKNLEPPDDPVDNGLQQMLGDMARKDGEHKTPLQPKKSIDIQQLIRDLLWQMATALPWSLLITLLFLMSVKTYRRLAPAWPWLTADGLTVVGYRSALDRLADRGFIRQQGDSREEFARQVAKVCPSMMRLTRLHLANRLGMREVSREDFQKAFRAVLGELNGTRKGWRYWLRLFNPVSWWSVN